MTETQERITWEKKEMKANLGVPGLQTVQQKSWSPLRISFFYLVHQTLMNVPSVLNIIMH